MIPPFNHAGVLPPYVGENPAAEAKMSPYSAGISEFVAAFSTSPARAVILRGFLDFRKALSEAGLNVGFQWIDGSFAEDVENNQGRDPNDIDLVTFFRRPEDYKSDDDWEKFVSKRTDLFDPTAIKEAFGCHAFPVDLNTDPMFIVRQSRYWFGLFSHRRVTALWKGMVQISLHSDDDSAYAILDERYPS